MITKTQQVVTVGRPDIRKISVGITGTAALIMNRWSEKATQQMADTQEKKPKQIKAARNPQKEYEDSMYRTPDGGYGFPSVAFKSAMVRAGTYADMKMTFLRGAFHVEGDLVKINGTPGMRTDHVRIGMGTADLRYRAEFKEWEAAIPIVYNANAITIEQLTNLLMLAGFSVGVGEWRPEKDGQNGTFVVKEGAE